MGDTLIKDMAARALQLEDARRKLAAVGIAVKPDADIAARDRSLGVAQIKFSARFPTLAALARG